MAQCGSPILSTESRLGIALILLSGGRPIEAMRTHGIAQSTAYENFERIIDAINASMQG